MATSKKDYEAIAAIFRRAYGDWDSSRDARCALDDLKIMLSDYFSSQNARFDWDRFVEACSTPDERLSVSDKIECPYCLEISLPAEGGQCNECYKEIQL